MIDAEKKGRMGLYAFGSVLIIMGFFILLSVLFGGLLGFDFFSMCGLELSLVGGFLVGFLSIIMGVIISNKARGSAKVNGFMLYGEALDEGEVDQSFEDGADE